MNRATRPTILFRFDASAAIGFGHAIRCFALSEELSARLYDPHFLVYPDTKAPLETLGIPSSRIHMLEPSYSGIGDARELARFAQHLDAQWIVLDGYEFDLRYQSELRAGTRAKVLALDDGVLDSFDADIILNQNLDAEHHSQYLNASSSKLLLGSRYLLVRQAFRHANPIQVRSEASNVLLMFGGADTHNITAQMLSVLAKTGCLNNRSVRVILGGAYRHRDSLDAITIPSSCNLEIVPFTNRIIDHYQWSDVVFSAAGSTAWELALQRLPMALITAADNQIQVATALARKQAAIYLGDIRSHPVDEFMGRALELLSDLPLRQALHTRCAELCDCAGPRRVVDAMEEITKLG